MWKGKVLEYLKVGATVVKKQKQKTRKKYGEKRENERGKNGRDLK